MLIKKKNRRKSKQHGYDIVKMSMLDGHECELNTPGLNAQMTASHEILAHFQKASQSWELGFFLLAGSLNPKKRDFLWSSKHTKNINT